MYPWYVSYQIISDFDGDERGVIDFDDFVKMMVKTPCKNDTEKDIRTKLSFDDVSDNFLKAAKFGIDTKFTWYKDKKVNAKTVSINKYSWKRKRIILISKTSNATPA